MDADQIRKEVADAAKAHYEAAMAGDTDALAQLIGDDVVYSHTNGVAEDKAAYLDRVARGTYRTMRIRHTADHIWVLSDDAAAVRGTTSSSTTGETRFRMDNLGCAALDVWVRRDGRWQLVAHLISLLMDDETFSRVWEAAFRR
jgi:ketosteroid isomerase-like protein